MSDRIYLNQLHDYIGQEVKVAGWVDVRRDHGKLVFFDLRDKFGRVQMVVLPGNQALTDSVADIRSEWVVAVTGKVNQRPEKMVKVGEQNGDLEIEILSVEILGQAKELPFDKEAELNLDTYLDNLPLTLRRERSRKIFAIQATIISAFREFLIKENFTEFQAPKLIGDDAEGGANSFNVEYFGHVAHLGQSPQLYKQIMVGIFERVFAAGNVYRAEKHSTTRHLNEYTSLDLEMGFIDGFGDIMTMENRLLAFIIEKIKEKHEADFVSLGAIIPEVPKEIPRLSLREAQELITAETGEDCTKEPDLEPQHERWLCDYAKTKLGSDFIFITNFPLAKRPFYTMPDPNNPEFAAGFDLLFRGVEITTGSQRIHDYDQLVASLTGRGMDPEAFSFYLQAFKYGMPPHGGLGLGLERLTAKLLGLDNVKEATLFPRDLNRIDQLLSK